MSPLTQFTDGHATITISGGEFAGRPDVSVALGIHPKQACPRRKPKRAAKFMRMSPLRRQLSEQMRTLDELDARISDIGEMIAETVADLCEVVVEEVAETTTENATRLFWGEGGGASGSTRAGAHPAVTLSSRGHLGRNSYRGSPAWVSPARPETRENTMKLIKISCPACDAPIHIDEDTAWAECPSCGATIHVDDEVQRSEHHITYDDPEEMGYLFEKGRQRAKEDAERERPPHDEPDAVKVAGNYMEGMTTRVIRFGARWLMRIALITGLAFGIGIKLRSMGRTQSQHESIETTESNDPTVTYLRGYEDADEEVKTPEPGMAIDLSMPAAVTITDENGVVAHVASRPSYEDNAAYISCIEITDDGGTYEVAMPPHTAGVVNTLFEQGAIAPQDGDVIIAGYDEGSGDFSTTLALGEVLTDETRQVLVTNLSAEGPDMSVIGRDTIDANAGFSISVAPGTSQEIAVPSSYKIHVHPYGTCALLRLIG